MYRIKKFEDCNAVFDLDTDKSRKLTSDEWAKILDEFPALQDPQCVSIFTDTITAIEIKL